MSAVKTKTKQIPFINSAAKVREIAKGIYDDRERRAVLRFVAKSVKLAMANSKTP